MPLPWPELLLFASLVLAVALYGLAALGHFPAEQRRPALRGPAGTAVLWTTLSLALLAGLSALWLAGRALPWPAAVLAGGTALLVAPLVLQYFSDTFVDGRSGLVVLAGTSGVLAAVAWNAAP